MRTDLAAPPARGTTTPRQDAVTLALGAWLVLGVFADGWAHFTVPNLESFFTPWHGALYSGLAATVGWFALLALPGWRAGRSLVGALPMGYQQGAAGAGLFGLGGLADLAWHQIFGVETGIDALLSPTHLLLFAGGLLILTSPLRARWSGDRLGPADRWLATGSATLATALTGFALIYTSAFATPRPVQTFTRLPENHPAHEATELPVVAGLAGYLVTTAVLVVPLLFLLQLIGLALAAGLGWPVELWSGVILLSAAVAGLLGALAGVPRVSGGRSLAKPADRGGV